jgi:hypothetical protein
MIEVLVDELGDGGFLPKIRGRASALGAAVAGGGAVPASGVPMIGS